MMPRSAQSSLSHWITARPGMRAGSSGTTSSRRPFAITMPPECWPRWRGRCCASWTSRTRWRTRAASGWTPASRSWRSSASFSSVNSWRASSFASRSICSGARPEDLAHLAHGALRAVGDDVRGHARAARAVALVDVLQDLLAAIARRQVDVDVRPLAALLGEEALEQELVAHGIDRGDAERVAHDRVGGRAAALAQDPARAALAHDVPDDQEVALEREAADDAELVVELRARLGRDLPAVALARALEGELAQDTGKCLPRGEREVGEGVAEVLELKGAALGDGERVRERAGEIGEALGGLGWGVEVALGVGQEDPTRVVEFRAVGDAGERIEQTLPRRVRVPHVAGRERCDVGGEEASVRALLVRIAVAPDLAEGVLCAEDLLQRFRERGLAHDRDESRREVAQLLPGDAAVRLLAPARAPR